MMEENRIGNWVSVSMNRVFVALLAAKNREPTGRSWSSRSIGESSKDPVAVSCSDGVGLLGGGNRHSQWSRASQGIIEMAEIFKLCNDHQE